MKDNFKAILGQLAPVVGAAIGGPWGGLAVKALAEGLGLKADADLDEIERVVASADPDKLVELRRVEAKFKTDLERLGVESERLGVEDRKDARAHQAKTADKTPGVIAAVVVSGFFGVLGALVFVTIPDAASAPLNIMLGALGVLLTQVGNFYFGSSAGSKSKDATVAEFMRAFANGKTQV
jgi:hypothetical protein